MCDPVSGDTPTQALHRAVDQLSEIERTRGGHSSEIDFLMERRKRAAHILGLARALNTYIEDERRDMLERLGLPSEDLA